MYPKNAEKWCSMSQYSRKAQSGTRQSLCNRKNLLLPDSLKIRVLGGAVGKIDARVFERFSDLFSLSVSHNQLDIINNDQ